MAAERPERVHLSTEVFEGLMLAAESLPGGQVWRLLAAANADVQPYEVEECCPHVCEPEYKAV